ncbi:hypothetical protein N1851_012333 [Merluccius polli]|uniref:Uncharacterized protein n=1 Tax=Merluccius polli TaxID=89951 RepID=A0AA47P2B1_MERPO|nr:hypothetical protein N1851_012333 [Merluccius polli]
MAEGTEYADGYNMEDWDFDEVMVETGVRGYLYEPQYSDEQLRAMEEQEAAEAAAATAEAGDLPAADEEPAMARARADWWYLCSHRCQFLLDEIKESEDDTDVCVVDHPSFAPHMDSGVLETYFRIPKPTGTFLSGSCKERDWAEGVESLPACVMQAIRQRYPAPDGQYCGHQEAEDAQDDL